MPQKHCQKSSCRRLMSIEDDHAFCRHCRPCNQDITCDVCSNWSEKQWYLLVTKQKHRKDRERQLLSRKRKAELELSFNDDVSDVIGLQVTKQEPCMDPDDYHWEPPTESEMKIIRAKRERSDKISSLMGSYMLKGYKMLGTSCELCGTILLRDKQQNDYCVACNELDTEHAKDNPVLSSEAAKVQAREYSMQSSTQSTERSSGPYEVLQNPQQEDVAHRAAPANMNPVRPQLASGQAAASTVESKSLIDDSIDAVTSKLAWANDELVKSSSCETCTQFCVLIKACAEALKALEHVAPKS